MCRRTGDIGGTTHLTISPTPQEQELLFNTDVLPLCHHINLIPSLHHLSHLLFVPKIQPNPMKADDSTGQERVRSLLSKYQKISFRSREWGRWLVDMERAIILVGSMS